MGKAVFKGEPESFLPASPEGLEIERIKGSKEFMEPSSDIDR